MFVSYAESFIGLYMCVGFFFMRGYESTLILSVHLTLYIFCLFWFVVLLLYNLLIFFLNMQTEKKALNIIYNNWRIIKMSEWMRKRTLNRKKNRIQLKQQSNNHTTCSIGVRILKWYCTMTTTIRKTFIQSHIKIDPRRKHIIREKQISKKDACKKF